MARSSAAMFILVLLSTSTITTTTTTTTQENRDFYVIAHMVNNPQIVRWALGAGVNALEIDVQFHSTTGVLTTVHHGTPCDCTCYLELAAGSVCDFDGVCTGYSAVEDVFGAIMSDESLSNLADVYIDSKMTDLSADVQVLAGASMVEAVESELLSKGYQGRVTIGVGSDVYLRAVAKRALQSTWLSQIYITYDTFSDTSEMIDTLVRLDFPNKIFSSGISVCSPTQYHEETALGAINKAHGCLSEVYAWTLDKESSWEDYYIAGARGIMTNYIHELLDWVSRKGLTLAKPQGPNNPAPAKPAGEYSGEATLDDVNPIMDTGDCDCDYSGGGCTIVDPAPPLSACRCSYVGAWTCSGSVVGCDQNTADTCTSPDTSIPSCVEGGGLCSGCDCSYSAGGCTVTAPPPEGYACQCSYEGAWTCSGSVTKCKDPSESHCNSPDKSLYSCLQGKGDCEGYYVCDCDYGWGGCRISQAAPSGSACRCDYEGAWTCSGAVVPCKSEYSIECIVPDRSLASCLEGGGDCGAY